jgi:hypothetical protein
LSQNFCWTLADTLRERASSDPRLGRVGALQFLKLNHQDMNSILSKLGCTALLAASFAISKPVFAAQDTAYNASDILLFFRNPAGTTGTDKVVYFSLGSSHGVFRDSATPGAGTLGTTISLGNIGSILTSTYSNDWTNGASSIFVGAVGQNAPTDADETSVENGDYSRTIYVTKARNSAGTLGVSNSASPIYNTATQTAVPSQIFGSNNISGMSQPGVVSDVSTSIDGYNPISLGSAGTAYGAISGGVMSKLGTQFAFGNVSGGVAALDLYRISRTTGDNATNAGIWHVANTINSTHTGTSSQGSPRADYLGTIVVSANGDVNFVVRGSAGGGNNQTPTTPTITTPPTAASITSGQTLANATLSGGSASVSGTFAFTSPNTTPSVGTSQHSVTFTPTDSGNYTTTTANVSVTVNPSPVLDTAYNASDVLLFFRNPAGTTGTDKVVYFSLGSSHGVFRDSATPGVGTLGTTISLGNIGSILTSTYSNDWTNGASSIFVGAVGQNAPTDADETSVENGDYSRTIYVTKARNSVGTLGASNSASPIYNTATQTAVPSQIFGSNNISGMSQPGVVSDASTSIDGYNPISLGSAGTAYGAISGGVMSRLSAQFTFGNVSGGVAALDLYRISRTTGDNATNAGIWHVANTITATHTGTSSQGSPRADYLGTIVLSANGDLNFVVRGSAGVTPTPTLSGFALSSNSVVLGSAAPTITAPTSASAGAITYTSSDTSVATISGSTITIVGAGNTTITATQAANGQYASATASVVLTVSNLTTPTLSGFALSSNSVVLGSAAPTITAPTSESAGAITYTSSNTSVATISGSTITIVGAGNTTITATQAANGQYASATASVVLTASNLTTPTLSGFALSSNSVVLGSAAPTITAPTSASAGAITYTSSDTSVATISGSTITIVGAGNTTITATQAPNGQYASATASVVLTVSSLTTPTLSGFALSSNSVVLGSAAPTITAPTSESAGAITYASSNTSVATISGSTITIVGAGNTTITATQAADGQYASATASVVLTVSNLTTPTLSGFALSSNSVVLGSAAPTITAPTSASAGAITYTSSDTNVATISGSTITIVGAGNTTITATQAADGQYASATASVVLTVSNLTTPTLSGFALSSNSVVLGSAVPTITAPISESAGAITYTSSNTSVATISGSTITIVGAGNTTITATQAANGQYASATASVVLTVSTPPAQAPVITSVKSAVSQIGVPFSYTITVNNTATGYSTTTLPSGLTLDSNTGVISGTPTGNATTSNITLTATNTGGNGTATLELYMAPASKTPPSLIFRNGVSLPVGGEISSYANGMVLTTNSGNNSGTVAHGVEVYALSSNATLDRIRTINLSSVFGDVSNISSVTSVVADPRGFGVASIVPTGITANDIGRIAIFDTNTGEILKTLNVGYHPDSVAMTPDRTKILVANEGEYNEDESFARPGSLSVIDISSVKSVSDIANLSQSNVATFDFQDFNLGTGVTLRGVRDNTLAMNTANTTANFANIEAEYITATNTQAYVTLQENNAIATFDFATRKFTRIANLGSITQTVDASDRDGFSNGKRISINDTVAGLPMPDTMVSFSKNGTLFLVTANEGDARPDDGDILSGADLISANLTSSNATTAINNGLTRLNLLNNVGDTNGDGKIDQPTMMGTRSFTIWNAATGNRTYDSGSTIETYVANNNPLTFNMNSGSLSKWDERSVEKGPEPEALAYGSIAGRDYVFVGNERENGVIAFDITNTADVKVAGYFNTVTNTSDSGGSFLSPESISFVPADQNPTRKNLLVVGYEGTETNGSLAVYEFRPPLSGNLTITSNGTATGRKDQPFNYAITANMPVISYSMNGTLPAGLSFDSTLGVISGTPTVSSNTTANVTLSVTASVSGQNGTLSNATATKPLSIVLAGKALPVISSNASASGTQGSPFSFTVAASNGPNTYSLTGALPTGLTFNATSGVIAGTPSVVGNFTIGLTARSSAGNSTAQPLALQIAAAQAPTVSIATIDAGAFEAFNTQVTPTLTSSATNAVKYQWRFNGKPIANAISANYNIGPAAANKVGNYSVVVTNAGNQSVTSNSIAFALKPAATLNISAGNQSLTQGFNLIRASGSNATFSANVTNTFGNATYQWFLNGKAITANGTSANYTIPFITANTTGSYRVQVTTRNGTTTIGTVVSPEWVVSLNGAPEVTNPGNLTASVGTPFSFNATVTGNASSLTINGTLPAGLTYNATVRRISGTPTAVGNFSIRLTPFGNATTGPGAPAAFNLVVSNPPTPIISNMTVNGNATSPTAQSLNTQAGPVFQVAVNNTGNHPLRYQWRLNGLPIVGANATTYNVGTTTAAKTGVYDVLVTNAVGVATASRQVNFSLAPVATFSIVGGGNQFLTPGNSTTFTVGSLTQSIPTATASYQWLKNGVAIAGAKGASYTANSTGIYSVQVTSTLGSTALGNVTSTSWSVATQDNSAGILVYNITGNATRTIGSTEFTGNFTGYMVVDRIYNNAALIQTYNVGFAKRNALEIRNDIAAASTGPVVGSRTVFAGSVISRNETVLSGNLTGNQSFTIDDPDISHDLVWISGRDVENTFPATTTPTVQPAVKLYAPATMSGVAGMLFRDGATVEIDSFNVTLTLNLALTANAYRLNQNLNQAIESTRAAARAAGFTDEVEE